MERILLTRPFTRWMRKSALTEQALGAAVEEMAAGLIDANLGGGVFKKRVALPGRGKRDGVRTIVAFQQRGIWIFLFAFEKSERDNISTEELKALRELASEYAGLTLSDIDEAVRHGVFTEI